MEGVETEAQEVGLDSEEVEADLDWRCWDPSAVANGWHHRHLDWRTVALDQMCIEDVECPIGKE